MLKAIRISSYILRNFSSNQQLVAQPKKLQKRLNVSKNIRWLHKDVKVAQRKSPARLSEDQLTELAHRSVSSTLGNSTIDSLQNFCTEFVNRMGPEVFQNFINKHELTQTKLIYLPHYKAYLKSCFKYFRSDLQLLQLLSYCDFRQLNTDSIPKLIREESFDNEHQIEHRSQYYLKMMPKPKWVFDDYLNTSEKSPVSMSQMFPVYLSESDIPHTDSEAKQNISPFAKKGNEKKPVIDRIITFTQSRSSSQSTSNWIYLQLEMGKDDMLNTKNIIRTLERIGIKAVKNAKLFHNEPAVDDKDLLEIENSLHKIDINLTKEMEVQSISELAKSSRTSMIKQPANEDEVLTGELSTNSSEMDKDAKRFTEMIKLTSRLGPKNKSYGFIEFESHEMKEKALNVYFRLFGIEMEKALLILEDADIKRTLRVSNLPWNLDPTEFMQWLKTVNKKEGSSMDFELDLQFRNYLSDASYVFITTNSFNEAMQLFEIINKHEYNNRKIYAEFRRGCGRFISGQIVENYYSAAREEREKAHIDRRTKQKEAWVKRHTTSD